MWRNLQMIMKTRTEWKAKKKKKVNNLQKKKPK